MTGQKKTVEIAGHLGHCIDYILVCEIETAQAEAPECVSKISGTLPIKARTSISKLCLHSSGSIILIRTLKHSHFIFILSFYSRWPHQPRVAAFQGAVEKLNYNVTKKKNAKLD